ncbi:hypothetical protein QBC34DRAFT_438471 [Podospora aff. communis PSN243]|uniref:Uncharacterized protein n=1 Tax=Podospora aff. communis PSN243 TaxID=3040156 RepID=A0AAV9GNF7_9PEZI|nr:hypothetical protein QBC34DRAFT_438471 [Podospora aff. communis PSN243]
MKLFAVLWALGWAIASVSAYDLYGAYERIMFYNAYLMDWGKTGGNTRQMVMGPGCVSKKKGSPCDLVEFIEYINNTKKTIKLEGLPANFDSRNMSPADVDKVAVAINKAEATGQYDTLKIHKEVGSRNNPDGVFQKTGQFIDGARRATGVSKNAVECAKAAVSRWAELRKYASNDAFAKHLEKKDQYKAAFKDYKPLEIKIGDTGEVRTTFNAKFAIPAIRALPGLSKWTPYEEMEEFKRDDPGHAKKVEIAKEVDDKLQCPID